MNNLRRSSTNVKSSLSRSSIKIKNNFVTKSSNKIQPENINKIENDLKLKSNTTSPSHSPIKRFNTKDLSHEQEVNQ